MAKQGSSVQKREREFKKRERERKKREKAALKRERRHGSTDQSAPAAEHAPGDASPDAPSENARP